MRSWDAGLAVAVIDAEKVTFAVGAPVFLTELLQRYRNQDFRGHRLRAFHTGAAPAAADIVFEADQCGITAWRAWGMTEAPTMSAGGVHAPLQLRAGTDGRVEAGTEIETVDDLRQRLPVGDVGELRLRSPKQMLGYLKAEHTAANVDADGWLYTGDLGSVDRDGWVTITGRTKDIINRGGEKFSSLEIERAIAQHPSIDIACVVPVPDSRLGEAVAAFVTIMPGHDMPTRGALDLHLETLGLARQKFPSSWTVLTEIPITPTGKIHKRLLAERAAADEAPIRSTS